MNEELKELLEKIEKHTDRIAAVATLIMVAVIVEACVGLMF